MAKESGMGMTVTVDDHLGAGQDISNDITSVGIRTPRAVQDITGVDKTAIERLLLLADAEVVLGGVFNDAANKSHAVFKTVPSTSVSRTVVVAISGQSLTVELLFEDYALTRGADGSLNWTATGRLQSGTAPSWS